MDTDRPLHEEWKKRVRTYIGCVTRCLTRDNRGSPTRVFHNAARVIEYTDTWTNQIESGCIFSAR